MPALIASASSQAQQPSPVHAATADAADPGCDRQRNVSLWEGCLRERIQPIVVALGHRAAIEVAKQEKARQPFKPESPVVDCWLAFLYAKSGSDCDARRDLQGKRLEDCDSLFFEPLKTSLQACRESHYRGLISTEIQTLQTFRQGIPLQKFGPREYAHNVGVGVWMGGSALTVAGFVTLGLVEGRILGGTTQCTDPKLGVLTNNCQYYPRQDYISIFSAAALTVSVGLTMCLPYKHYRYNKFDAKGRPDGQTRFCTPIFSGSN